MIPEALQELENLLKTAGHNILVHPLSEGEIQNHKNEQIREKSQSKIATYAKLTFPPYPSPDDDHFYNKVNGSADSDREQVDNALLYAVYDDRVDLLITEDQPMHTKADLLGITDKVLTIEEGAKHFREKEDELRSPVSIQKVTVGELGVDDPIFDSLKEEYGKFEKWFADHPDRDAWVNWNRDGTLGAVLILKYNEAEELGENPTLSPKPRLKINTLKVSERKRGSKAGELLISLAVRESINRGLEEIYLTHYIDEESDYLVKLISKYGFQHASNKEDDEAVFVKRLTPGPGDDPDPLETVIRFYPSFQDGPHIEKFLIPIQPKWHNKLFATYDKRQPTLPEVTGQFIPESNAIKKAYLTHANIRRIEPADILIFYRSHDNKEVTSLGVCEQVKYGVEDPDELMELVGRRSVFSINEITKVAQSPTTVLLFKWHFDFADPIRYQVLRDEDILAGPPQTIQQLDESSYERLKKLGDIDERFIIN
ncbi:hypothetical protein [Halobellus salinisoli]|uniref:hypothetical protein n=1 Tax=Halobellus salinisoli TaxID=3108500 RepID=UPI0030091D9C